ncbi:MAG: hypothetical protein KF881_04365 [Acidobacteria bacterium]|nr:hypothetical protein [Acidobacteriota bacterium]
MKNYKVFLHRDYVVEMSAQDETEARKCAEFFVTDGVDGSTKEHQNRYNFEITSVRSMTNDAYEVEEIDNGNPCFKF